MVGVIWLLVTQSRLSVALTGVTFLDNHSQERQVGDTTQKQNPTPKLR